MRDIDELLDQLEQELHDPLFRKWFVEEIETWLDVVPSEGPSHRCGQAKLFPLESVDHLSVQRQCAILAAVHDVAFNGPQVFTKPDKTLFHGMAWEMALQGAKKRKPEQWIVELRAMLRNVKASAKVTPASRIAQLRESLERCQRRLDNAAEKYRQVGALLVHYAELGNDPEPLWPDCSETQGKYQLNSCGGPHCDHKQLLDAEGEPAVADKPFMSADGDPMVYSDGSPIAFYPGALRSYSLYGVQFQGSSESDYSEAVAEYIDAATELGRLLDDMPVAVKSQVWRNWLHGFAKPQAADLWTNAVFELAWQKHPGSGLEAERKVWHENTAMELECYLDIQSGKQELPDMFRPLVEHAGNPPAYWYSWIPNVWRASIAAIDVLRLMLRQTPAEIAGQLSADGIAGVRALVLHLQAHQHPRIHATKFQNDTRSEGGDALAAAAELERLGVIEGKLDAYQSATVYHFDAEFVRAILESLPTTSAAEPVSPSSSQQDALLLSDDISTLEGDDALPAKQRRLSPSRVKAKALYDWAMSEIKGFEDMTIKELYEAIESHTSDAYKALPPNAETFGKYLRDAGVKKYSKQQDKAMGKSIQKAGDL